MAAKSALDIFRVLPQTNCGDCRELTCMAFAVAVIKKHKELSLCPHLDRETVARLGEQVTTQMAMEESQQERLEGLRRQVREIDLESRAEALGGRASGGELTINCLGKEFTVDASGRITSHCHTHAWFSIPFLTYILFGQGREVTGRWTSFRNLKDGTSWDIFFDHQCPQKLKKLADEHNELFGNLISAFGATMAKSYLEADISVILHPFPKVPMMVCYWQPEDDLESDLRVFFDSTADQNLTTEAVFGLGTAIVRMLEKITERHV